MSEYSSVIAEELSQRSDIELSVLVRRHNRLSAHVNATRFVGAVAQGDVLQEAMKGQDAVIFCLAGDLPRMFAQVRQAMEQNGVSRIVAISSSRSTTIPSRLSYVLTVP